MSYRVVLLAAAQREILAIYAWLSERSPQGAGRWYNRFTEALKTLETAPLSCGFAPENGSVKHELRQIVFKTKRGNRFRVIFMIEEETVYVLHVRGSGQRLLRPDEI